MNIRAKTSMELASDERMEERRRVRIAQIEDSLARPGEEPGPEWDKRRARLERELDYLKAQS